MDARTNFPNWLGSCQDKTAKAHQLDTLAEELILSAQANATEVNQCLFWDLGTVSLKKKSQVVSWSGISVKWFNERFFKSAEEKAFVQFQCPMWFIRNHCIPQLVKQVLHGESACLIDLIESCADASSSERRVADSDSFISYTGSYTLETFQSLTALLPERYYYWCDVFCVDQVEWKLQGDDYKDKFMYQLKKTIARIPVTALFLGKWDDIFTVLSQIWVVWEIFSAADASPSNASKLLFIMSHSEHVRLALDGSTSGTTGNMWDVLSKLDARNARARLEEDTNRILRVIEEAGINKVNIKVLEQVRKGMVWIIENLLESTADGKSRFEMMGMLSRHLYDLGNHSKAERLCRESLPYLAEHYGTTQRFSLEVTNVYGLSLMAQGHLRAAEFCFREIGRNMEKNEYPKLYWTIRVNIGVCLSAQNRGDEALREYIDIIEKMPGEGTDEAENKRQLVFVEMGRIYASRGEIPEAKKCYQRAIVICESLYGLRHPQSIITLENMAVVLVKEGDYEQAMENLNHCINVTKEIYGEEHKRLCKKYNSLGTAFLQAYSVERKDSQLSAAEGYYRQAIDSACTHYGEQHDSTTMFEANLIPVLKLKGKDEEAQQLQDKVDEKKAKIALIKLLCSRPSESSDNLKYCTVVLQLQEPQKRKLGLSNSSLIKYDKCIHTF